MFAVVRKRPPSPGLLERAVQRSQGSSSELSVSQALSQALLAHFSLPYQHTWEQMWSSSLQQAAQRREQGQQVPTGGWHTSAGGTILGRVPGALAAGEHCLVPR